MYVCISACISIVLVGTYWNRHLLRTFVAHKMDQTGIIFEISFHQLPINIYNFLFYIFYEMFYVYQVLQFLFF